MSVGSLNQTIEQRKKLAKDSWSFQCEKCGSVSVVLKERLKKSIKEENVLAATVTPASQSDLKVDSSTEDSQFDFDSE